MKTRIRVAAVICLISVLSIVISSDVMGAGVKENVPGADGGIIRIGYSESEEYGSFTQLLLDIALGLVEEGSIDRSFAEKYKDVNFEEKFSVGDTVKLWDDICDSNVSGAKYRFVREAFFNMDDMDRHEYRSMINRDDVDIML